MPLLELLQKYGGERVTDDPGGSAGRRRFRLRRLPPYLLLSVRRFARNRFFTEKNPTIVNFPVRGLDFRAALPPGALPAAAAAAAAAPYDLAVSISHVGDARPAGRYTAYVQRASERPGTWCAPWLARARHALATSLGQSGRCVARRSPDSVCADVSARNQLAVLPFLERFGPSYTPRLLCFNLFACLALMIFDHSHAQPRA